MTKIVYFLLIIFLITSAAEAGWYSSSWKYRQKITVKSELADENLSNFPLLIKITDQGHDLFDEAQVDGDDIVFTTSTGTAVMPHEIESYSGTGPKELYAWVNVPSISSSSDTTLYMYYGNSACSSQQQGTGTWSNGYEAVWHLNESSWSGAANEVIDSTVNSHNGAAYSGSAQDVPSTATGLFSRGGQFEKSKQQAVSVAHHADLNLTSGYTVEVWMKQDENWPMNPINKEDAIPNGWFMYRYYTSLILYHDNASSGGSGINYDTNWHHYTASWNQATGYTSVYWDGHKIDTRSKPGPSATTAPLYIGWRPRHANYGMEGLMDEARVSTTPRSDAWVAATYRALAHPGQYIYFEPSPNFDTGLVGCWEFNETSGGYVLPPEASGLPIGALNSFADTSGQDVDANSGWTATKKWGAGALKFDGSNDYVGLPSADIIGSDTTFSIEMWVKPLSLPSGNDQMALYGEFQSSNTRNYLLIDGSNQNNVFSFDQYLPSGGFITSTTSASTGNWFHIAYVQNGSNRIIFVNGVNESEDNSAETYAGGAPTNAYIGKRESPAYPFNGIIDSTRIYNRALTQAEIVEDMWSSAPLKQVKATMGNYTSGDDPNFDSDLVLDLELNETSGGTANAPTGTSLPAGTLYSFADTSGQDVDADSGWTATKKWGAGGLKFDGSNDYVQGDISGLPTTGTGTFCFWSNNDTTSGVGCAISFQIEGTSDVYLNIYPYYNGNILLSAAWKSWTFDNTGDAPVTPGEWAHYAFTVGSSTLHLYLNGREIWQSGRTTSPSAPISFRMGNRYYSNTPYNGIIDSVRIYNRALTQKEIVEDMWSSQPLKDVKTTIKGGLTLSQ